jgi:MFS family permease
MNQILTLRLIVVLIGNTLLRIAMSSSGAVIAFYLAARGGQGAPEAGVVGGGHGGGAGIVGALGVVLNLAELIGALPVGVATDRFSARIVLVGGSILGGIATLMFGLSQEIAIFFFARGIQGVVAVIGGPPLLSLITEATRDLPTLRNRIIGFYELSLLSGLALGALVGGSLWANWGTHAFSVLSAFYIVIAALFWWGANIPGQMRAEQPMEALRHALSNPFMLKLAPAWLALNAVIGLWLTNVTFQLSSESNPIVGQVLVARFTPQVIGLILLVFTILFATGIIIWTFQMGRISRVDTMKYSIYGLIATCFGLLVLNINPWPLAIEWVIVAIVSLAIMVGSGFTPAALAYLASLADANGEGRGSTMGIYTLLLGLGGALGAGIGGWLASSFAFNGLIIGSLVFLALALFEVFRLPEDLVPTAKTNQSQSGASAPSAPSAGNH